MLPQWDELVYSISKQMKVLGSKYQLLFDDLTRRYLRGIA